MSSPRTRRRRPAPNALNAVAGAQWAIQRDVLETITAIASRANLTPEALEAIRGEPLDNTRIATIRDGVAAIPVRGPLFCYANMFTRCSGATSYADIATDFRAALDNPMVRAILLVIDSPGGEVNGCAELAAMIYEARGRKPIIAYVSGQGTSAAYWIAAAADEVVVANTAIVGSIGCIWGMEIVRRNDETIEEYVLVSSQSPKKNVDIRTDAGRAELQSMLDALADVFVAGLAEYRAVTVENVLSDFGQGGMFVGEAAVAPGLADRIGSYEELLAELANPAGPSATLPMVGGRASTATTSEGPMAKAKPPAGRRSAPQGSAAATSEQAKSKQATDDEEDQKDGGVDDDEEDSTGKKAKSKAAVPDDESDDDDDETDDTSKKKKDEDDESPDAKAATIIRQAKAEERDRVARIRALTGPADVIEGCINDPDCTPEAAAYRLMTGQAGKAKGASRLTQLRQDDAGTHASAQAPKGNAASTPRELAKASVDRFYELTTPKKRTA